MKYPNSNSDIEHITVGHITILLCKVSTRYQQCSYELIVVDILLCSSKKKKNKQTKKKNPMNLNHIKIG